MKDRRLRRITINILILTLLLTVAALLFQSRSLGAFGVLIGGLLAFVYFKLLAGTVTKALSGVDEERGLDNKTAARLGFKLLLYTFALALITILVIIGHLAQPIAFLVGFSALVLSIGFEALVFAAFSKPRELPGDDDKNVPKDQ